MRTLERLCFSVEVQVSSIFLEIHGLEGSISKEDTDVETRALVLILEDYLDPTALHSFFHRLLVIES